jgi:hypothetical protein
MKEKLFFKIKSFFNRPDWIFSKQIFIALIFIPTLSCIFLGIFIFKNIDKLKNIKQEVIYLEKLFGLLKGDKNSLCDENFIINNIEKINFLSKERENLLAFCEQVDNKERYSGIKQMLDFFENSENHLRFQSSTLANNLVWDQIKQIEVSHQDLLHLISIIEGEKSNQFNLNLGRPNMFISKLKWQKSNKSSDIYTLDIQIIQKRSG